ncbi:MAG: T9SS type A sorting domain-containing protein [Bacteroidetes bacterium]|nr:T9SS type A sorting domain-containing protein [Bacteroidota bacterium]
MKKNLSYILVITVLALLTGGWGSYGHKKISEASALSYNQEMQDFNLWASFLADHASDADYRKQDDPNESPKHYIDIDSYYAFLLQGRIPQTLDSVTGLYGHTFVYDNGILPYATVATVDLLQHFFELNDLENAKVVAADLGHYVGDGHMPLHITKNYDGDETGNHGIHSRYESTMIRKFVDQIIYTGDSVSVVPDVTSYVFKYIYNNYKYIDSVLLADDYATAIAGGATNNDIYTTALWDKSKGFTTQLMKNASHSLTELIYTAWVKAGKPSISANAIEEYEMAHGSYLAQLTPNPFENSAKIRYSLIENNLVDIKVLDLSGKLVDQLLHENKSKGYYELEWNPGNIAPGVYYMVMTTEDSMRVRKIVHL